MTILAILIGTGASGGGGVGPPPPPSPPTGIQILTASPINVSSNATTGDLIARAQLSGGNPTGAGTWTKDSGFTKSRVANSAGVATAPVIGKDMRVEVSGSLAPADEGTGKSTTIKYTGETVVLTKSVGFNVIEPPASVNPWLSGMSGVFDDEKALPEIDGVGRWRNEPVRMNIVYTGAQHPPSSWSSLRTSLTSFGNIAHLKGLVSRGILPMIDLPTAEAADKGNFSKIINDTTIHGYIRQVADLIRDAVGTSPVVVVLARECNHGASFPWWAGHDTTANKTLFKGAFQKVVSLMRESGRLDNANHKFAITIQKDPDNSTLELDKIWPGDDFVDYVGYDFYDANGNDVAKATSTGDNYSVWKQKFYNKWADFTDLRGKRGFIQEWGLMCKERNGGSDNAMAPKHFHRLFTELGSFLLGEMWFRQSKNFPVGKTVTDFAYVIHSCCYKTGGTTAVPIYSSGTPFAGPSSYAGGTATGGAFVGSTHASATKFASQSYLKLFGKGF